MYGMLVVLAAGIMLQNLPSLLRLMLIAIMTTGGQAANPARAEEVEVMTTGGQAGNPKRAEEVDLEMIGITIVISAAAFQVMNGGVLVLSQINRLLEDLNPARAPRAPRDVTTKTPTRAH
jgi:hypothetical protein